MNNHYSIIDAVYKKAFKKINPIETVEITAKVVKTSKKKTTKKVKKKVLV